MKILLIGLLVLICWSAPSTYIYVCKIKGLCNETKTVQIGSVNPEKVIAVDTLAKPLVPEKAPIPENLSTYFAFDKSDFKPDAVTARYFDESNAFLGKNSNARLFITGHTDAIGSDEYNQALGYRRAQTMQQYFAARGMPAGKIIIESKGKKEPADKNNTTTGRAKNRRTVITIKN